MTWNVAGPSLKLRPDDLCDVSIHGALHSLTKLDEAIFKLLGRPQRQRDVKVTSRYERNAISDKYRNDADDELVDGLRVKKRSDDLAGAHQPDILTRLLSKTAHEWADCIIHELHA